MKSAKLATPVVRASRRGGVESTNHGIVVVLGLHEAFETQIEGVKRRLRHEAAGYADRDGSPSGCLRCHEIEAACAERAFARAMNLYWAPSEGVQKEADVSGWEVRQTEHAAGKLMVRKPDKDGRPYVLVTGSWPRYVVRGYLLARDAKRDRWFRSLVDGRDPCYWVPQNQLVKLRGDEGPWPIRHHGDKCGTDECPACRYELAMRQRDPS